MSPALSDALNAACAAVQVAPPKRQIVPGRWVRTDTLGRNGRNDASVLIFDDGRGGMVWNHQTAASQRFTVDGESVQTAHALRRDPERERREEAQRQEVERVCANIVRGCSQEPHPYLAKKGFAEEPGLVCAEPREFFPRSSFGEAMARALPEGDGPFLIVPGRIGKRLTTVQFITPKGEKKNILRGQKSGAAHRISTGAETWVCEGIATALSVRAALRLLGQPATVLSAFDAANVGRVASGIPGARIAADHDRPAETLGGVGAGEYYAARSGRAWTMPPMEGEDFNDMHKRLGLRAVALHLREAPS